MKITIAINTTEQNQSTDHFPQSLKYCITEHVSIRDTAQPKMESLQHLIFDT